MLNSIIETIGHTPLLYLQMSKALPGNVWIKLETRNPGGSIKDRIAFRCLMGALARGELKKGDVAVTASKGNLGISLAIVGRYLGIAAIVVMPESANQEMRDLVGGYGADIVLTPAEKGLRGALEKAGEIRKEKKAWLLDQFSNPDAVKAHYETTGPEILQASAGQAHVLVAGVATGATLTGAGKCLKETIPHFRLIAVEPEDPPASSGGKPGADGIPGLGAEPQVLDKSLIDEVIRADSETALDMAKKVMAEEGVCCGLSSGANINAALHVAARPEMQGKNIVTFVCDGGERYLSTALFK